MGIKRIVDVSFWTDGKVDDFSPEDKYFMLYLLTNPFTKQLGIYEISIKQAAFQMGYSVEAVTVLLERFETKYKMIRFSRETNEIAILNFLRYSVMKGGKPVEDCIKQDMAKVKNKKLIDIVFHRLHGIEGLNPTVKKIVDAYMNDNDNHNDNHNDNDNDRTGDVTYHDTYHVTYHVTSAQDIADLFNTLSPSLPAVQVLSESTKAEIEARLSKYTLADFERLFTKAEASDFLKGKNKRKWAATFDWLVKDENMAKVLNGNYDNQTDIKRSYDIEAIERMVMKQQNPPPTVADSPEIRARAEALQQQLAKPS